MKIKTKSLATALNECGRALKTRTTLPILNHVRLEASSGALTLRATSLDIWIERIVDCDGDLPACCVSLSLLMKLTEYAGTPEVELSPFDKKLEFRAGRSLNRVKVLNSDEFPRWPDQAPELVAVNAVDLADGIEAVSWTTIEPTAGRPNLENVQVLLSPTAIECLGYNGRVFAHYNKPAVSVEKSLQIPHDFTPALVSALKQPESSLIVSGSHVLCCHRFGRTMVKRSELPFPEGWRTIVANRDGEPFARIESSVLKLACSNALAMSSTAQTAALRVDWRDDGTLVLESTGDVGAYHDETELEGAFGGGYAQLSATYLLGALAHLGETVQFTPAEGISFWASDNLVVGIGQLGPTPPHRVIQQQGAAA